jgi:hypothetical protein
LYSDHLLKDHKSSFATSISGDHAGGYRLDVPGNRTIFDNGVLNQIFLSDYLERNLGLSFSYQKKDGEPQVIVGAFRQFI